MTYANINGNRKLWCSKVHLHSRVYRWETRSASESETRHADLVILVVRWQYVHRRSWVAWAGIGGFHFAVSCTNLRICDVSRQTGNIQRAIHWSAFTNRQFLDGRFEQPVWLGSWKLSTVNSLPIWAVEKTYSSWVHWLQIQWLWSSFRFHLHRCSCVGKPVWCSPWSWPAAGARSRLCRCILFEPSSLGEWSSSEVEGLRRSGNNETCLTHFYGHIENSARVERILQI